MQVPTRWTPPSGTLGELVAAAHVRVTQLSTMRGELEAAIRETNPAPDFVVALQRPDVAIIAELKRRSPSRGEINPHILPADQAAAYTAGGAAAISVLTEPDRFGGTPDDLPSARAGTTVPLLRKDFLVHPLQLMEARVLSASAALLIVRALDPACLEEMIAAARSFGLEPLVEVHTEAEVACALALGARVIGVNNRDLETLRVDATIAARLIPQLPAEVVAVAESGMIDRAHVASAGGAGADAVLVGTALSASADPKAAVRAMTGIPRRRRA